ncbi:hypothetical protein Taro_037390 [Colocasia esculenta]|uniref:NAC domain-containing protein n=1 Tax=Colocasia esculenta TaxID=4460 RepID=A0A843W0D0_COLES|nr:hypothetical protein [Colocasia esculenta]
MEEGYVLPPGGDNVYEQLELPPGFRFHPTDEELVTYYLSRKVADHCFSAGVIGEVELNTCEPWDLPCEHKLINYAPPAFNLHPMNTIPTLTLSSHAGRGAKMGEKEWYFFCVRDRKYPAGLRTNRATDSGYWKATGKDKEVRRGTSLVGRKKTLVFYRGRAPKGEKTCWVMHEYHLDGSFSRYNKAAKNEWVICRVFQKGSRSAAAAEGGGGGKKVPCELLQARTVSSAACYGNGVRTGASNISSSDLLPPLMELPFGAGTGSRTVGATTAAPGTNHVTCFSNAAARHKSHEGPVDCHSYSPFFIATSADSYDHSSGISSSALQQGKLSGEAGLMNLVRSHGYAAQEGIGGKVEMGPGRSMSQETDVYRPGSSPLPLVSSHEVFGRQKVPSSVTIPLADCIWNY